MCVLLIYLVKWFIQIFLLFCSSKEALDIHVQNMKHVEVSVSPVPETQPDTHEVEGM